MGPEHERSPEGATGRSHLAKVQAEATPAQRLRLDGPLNTKIFEKLLHSLY